MRLNLCLLLYENIISNVPLFRGLSGEVVAAPCRVVRPMSVIRNHDIMREGEPGYGPTRWCWPTTPSRIQKCRCS